MFKYDIYFKCVIVSWSSATGSHYSMEFSVQNGGGNSHVMGATVAMERSIEFRLLCFYVMKCLADEPSQVTGFGNMDVFGRTVVGQHIHSMR